jgi:hypothetical protein
MAGRERIVVAADDTLDDLLEQLRVTDSAEVVLDVDERSPLLISLQQLHSLDEVAQAHGVQVMIASTNSKLLNAARVFGLDVIDTRAMPLPAPEEPSRLLAGQPLGHVGQELYDDEGDEPDEMPARVGHVVRITRPDQVTRHDNRQIEAEEDWDEPPPLEDEPQATAEPGSRIAEVRYDRYGQAYQDDDEDEEANAESRPMRSIRLRRPAASHAGATTGPDAAGWDDEQDQSDEADVEYREARRPRAWRPGAGFWGDVRAWIAARRAPATTIDADDEFADEAAEPGRSAEEEGWDEVPYQARSAARRGSPAMASTPVDGEDDADPDEPPAAPPTRIRGRREITTAQREQTARLPVITSAIAYDAYDAAGDEEYADDAYADDWRQRGAAGGTSRFALGSLLFTLLIVATLVGVALYLLIPTATVTLAARTGQISTEFRVVVGEIDPNSPEGRPTSARIVVPAKRITVPLSATASRPATGARLEPDVTAGGSVVVTNPSPTTVTVPKGTALAAVDGRSYITTEAITIGPSDPFAGTFGSAMVKVAAGIRGSGGNAAIDAVRGQLPSGVYYTNKNAPIAGGSDRRIATISAQDRAAAQAAAEEVARAKGPAALNGAIPVGSTIMQGTNGTGNFKVEFNAKEGSDGDSVTATVTAEVTTLVYTASAIEVQARAEAERRLTAQAKPGEPIVTGSTQINPPKLIEDIPGQQTYLVTGTANTRAALGSEAEREQLARDLARQDDDEVRRILAGIPGVASSTVTYETGIFPERMPWLPSHIKVQIAEAR